jgi:hypothetical protein
MMSNKKFNKDFYILYSLRIAETGAHAKLAQAGLHTLANHEAVAWLKDVQGAGDGGEAERAHKDGDVVLRVLSHAGQLTQFLLMRLLALHRFLLEVCVDDGLKGVRYCRPPFRQVLKIHADKNINNNISESFDDDLKGICYC